jgi:site-specific recombinase XerD
MIMNMTTASKKNPRGVFEKVPGSGEWWIRYIDATGKLRREKVGTKSAAIALVEKRRTEVRERLKLPENFRARPASFADLSKDALAYSRARKLSHRDDQCRMAKIVEEFGDRIAEGITSQEIDSWLEAHEEWMVATKNRYLALLKLTYRLGEENRKIKTNPARLLHMRKENNARVRYLNQYDPLPTKLDYLKSCKDEESRLRAVIKAKYSFHMPELEIAIHTGMRRSEQYGTEWPNVNFERRMVTLPRSKHGEKRHIPLNAAALAAFKVLLPNMATSNFVFLNMQGDDTLQSNRHWFEDAVAEAGIGDLTWHDLRHTFASRLVMVGVDLRTVQELMGHKTIQMTCRYAHLAPAHQLAAVERLLSFNSASDKVAEVSASKRNARKGNKVGRVFRYRETPNSLNSSLSCSVTDTSTIWKPRTAILEQSTDTSTDTKAKSAMAAVTGAVP